MEHAKMEKKFRVSGTRSQISNLKFQTRPFWADPLLGRASLFILGSALLSFAFTFSLSGNKTEPEKARVRKAAVAGGFYPADPKELSEFVDAMLRQADPPRIESPIRAIMVPHAGYIYSGPVAAYAYKELENRDIRTVILIGNSHRHYFDGIAIDAKGAFETPLGLVPIDEMLAAKLLAADPAITDRPDMHESDHVLEVQLPFLQRVLEGFKIVPILFSGDSPELAQKLANILPKLMDEKTLIVASTDMSHYPPYADAVSADKETLNAILSGKTDGLNAALQSLAAKHVPNAETFLCSPSGVRVAMLLAQGTGNLQPVLLKYANSGDSPVGEKGRVVGYGAVAFVAKQSATPAVSSPVTERKEAALLPPKAGSLEKSEQTELLKIARSTVESYVKTGKVPEFSPASPALRRPLGAFVTLKERGQLRGCIGRFEPSEPLYRIVQQMAVSAATEDPRFRPVDIHELDKLVYEISVLSPQRKIQSAAEIILGKHGVTVSKGFHHGVFLPQVATETGWSKEEFLGELCSQKAGLPRDCWKDPGVTLEVFTAEVLSEEKKQG
jgi:hypothetical protein